MKYLIKRMCCGFIEESDYTCVALYKCLNCGIYNPQIKCVGEKELMNK